MKKQIYILATFLLIVLASVNSFGQSKIQILSDNKGSVNIYGISKFYFVHQIFADAFYMTDLYKQLDYDESARIINAIYYGITDKDKVTIIVNQDNSPDARLVFFTKIHPESGNSLVMMTNFNNETRKFDKDIDDKNSIVRWYFIRGNKLVYRQDIYSEKTEKEKKGQAPHKLIDYYLFDDNLGNDSKVKGLIDDILNNEKSDKIEVLYAKLYLGELYLLNSEIDKAEKEVSGLKEYFEKYKDNGIPSQYSLITNMAETELELMKRMNK